MQQVQQGRPLVVFSAEAQERAEKYLTLTGGMKVPRSPDEKTAWMLPHTWLPLIAASGPELAVVEWTRQVEAYFRNGNAVVPDIHQEKYQRCLAMGKIWLRCGHGPDVAGTSADQFRAFINNTELMLELFLLCRKATTASHSAVTSFGLS